MLPPRVGNLLVRAEYSRRHAHARMHTESCQGVCAAPGCAVLGETALSTTAAFFSSSCSSSSCFLDVVPCWIRLVYIQCFMLGRLASGCQELEQVLPLREAALS